MSAFWGFITIAVAIKGLGGAFLPVVRAIGLESYQYPLVALLVVLCYLAFLISFRKFQPRDFSDGKGRTWLILAIILCLAGLLVRLFRLYAVPIDANVSDMVPNLLAGLDDVLAGVNPYRPHLLAHGGTISHFYLPTLWMPYLPLHWAGVDVRYLNIIAIFVFYALIVATFARSSFRDTKWTLGFLLALAFHAFSRQAVHEVAVLHTGPMWIYLSVFLWATLSGKDRWRDISFALLLFCRETAAVFLLPFYLHLFLTNRAAWLRLTTRTLATAAVVVLPFLILSPSGFFASAMHYAMLPKQDSVATMLALPGFLGLIKMWGWMSVQWVFRLSGTMAALVGVSRSRFLTSEHALAFCGMSYLVFIQFVSTAWPYVYAPFIQMLFFLYLRTERA